MSSPADGQPKASRPLPENSCFRDRPLVIGTRKSKLALWQTNRVIDALTKAWTGLQVETREFTTVGDKTLDSPLPKIGQKGVFTAELDAATRESEIDLAIHSLKDLPTQPTAGLQIVPVLAREDARDVLVSKNGVALADLKPNAVVGTSSYRRQSQLLAIRPDLQVQSVRGNVPTRVAKAHSLESPYDAVILASAGIVRLELNDVIADWLPLEQMLPAPGQAAMAATFRSGHAELKNLLLPLLHKETIRCVEAERAFLAAMGGGCSSPIAAWARFSNNDNEANGELTLTGRVASLDGQQAVTKELSGNDGVELAKRLAQLVLESGGQAVLDSAKPLNQKRVLVTRAAEQSASLEELLRDQGAVPVAVPMIQFRQTNDTSQLEHLESFDWILFTSSNAIRYFFKMLPLDQRQRLAKIKLGCVGSQTAKTLAEFECQSDFVPSKFSSERLAEEIDLTAGQRILYPCPLKFNPDLPESLRAAGAAVVTWPLYETIQVDLHSATQSLIDDGVDIVTFASPSVVSSYCEQVPDYKAQLQQCVVACIGPMTRRRATELGIEVNLVPEEFTAAGLVSALVKHFEGDGK